MRLSRLFWRMILAGTIIGPLAACKTSLAESYQIVPLSSDQARFLYGVDDAGTVVINDSAYCGASTCFATYVAGTGFIGLSTTAPALAYDNGVACMPAVPGGFLLEHAVCNGSLEAFTGRPSSSLPTTGVYNGPDLLADLVAYGGEGVLMLNSSGDIVFDDVFSEEFYEAIPQAATPEPASILLLVTAGVLIAFAGTNRRWRVPRPS